MREAPCESHPARTPLSSLLTNFTFSEKLLLKQRKVWRKNEGSTVRVTPPHGLLSPHSSLLTNLTFPQKLLNHPHLAGRKHALPVVIAQCLERLL